MRLWDVRVACPLLFAVSLSWSCSGSGVAAGVPGGMPGQSGNQGNSAAAQAGANASLGGGASGAAGVAGGLGSGGASDASDAGAGGVAVAGAVGMSSGGSGGDVAGASGAPSASSAIYMIGADITSVQAAEARGATYSDGTPRDILQLLKRHGFNYVRLRTFVDPKATDGYDRQDGYADLAHTIAFGKRIKQAGMGFLLDFHYSDNWADPGKQCVPVAWQGSKTIDQLAAAVHTYTKDAITRLIAGGARPDLVQIGNEITSGMLIHLCDSAGRPTGNSVIGGSILNWSNLGALLKAGVQGVKEVDPAIKIMLHIDRGGDKGGYTGDALGVSTSFISNAQKQGVVFDVFGESCYQSYQGDPSSPANTRTDWANTFAGLAAKFPSLQFVAAEYGPLQREINDVVFGLSGNHGMGTFNWEPSQAGDWNTGHALFSAEGDAFSSTADLALYDAMRVAYASRL